MTDYVLSFDPGLSTGIALLSVPENEVPRLEYVTQFDGGAEAVEKWLKDHWMDAYWSSYSDDYVPAHLMFGPMNLQEHVTTETTTEYQWTDETVEEIITPPNLTIICEAFTARNTQGFSYTTASLEALPVIGVLIAHGLVDRTDKKRYRDPKFQYLVGGTDLPDKRKRQHRFLEESGYFIGRKEIGATLKDYNDARSATAHGLNYITRELKHRPTHEMIAQWGEENGS